MSLNPQERGTTLDMKPIFDNLPSDLQVALAQSLRFVTDDKTGISSIFSKVPFLAHLSTDDLIRVGVRMPSAQIPL